MKLPKIAYILLWFPKPSETFIFREVVNLRRLGLPVEVFTLYGQLSWKLSSEMQAYGDVKRLGIAVLKRLPGDITYWRRKKPELVWELFRTLPIRKWKSLEFGGENIFAFLCAFTLARMFEKQDFDHIHAPWAMGPAMAAWIASRLTGIPFSFAGRAGDIYPPDGALKEKIRDSLFVISENMTNVPYLNGFLPQAASKIYGIYNGIASGSFKDAPVVMKPPYQLLALGRFDRIKAFEVLLQACGILKESGLDFHLTLAGDGPRRLQLKYWTYRLGLKNYISYPGFIPHDRVSELFCSADIFVMSSAVHKSGDRDGLPTVIMEALMHRLPVVSTNVCGIPEVIINNETGLLVRQKDPPALAGAIRKVISDRSAALEMAEKGRELVLNKFDPVANHGRIFDLFLEKAGGLHNS
ncbi:MAG TPA: glycosyltransferase family 4 protein [Deltaproteobacteria bacterium]|nr:glycosyltransferase family 4 protein [Deltaproteobacteria bacterium]